MTTPEEKLLLGVLTQFELGRIDYDKLATFIGVATPKAARCRWDRYKQKLTKGAGPTTLRRTIGVSKKIGSVSPKKAGDSPKKNTQGSPKKSRGRVIKQESDEEDEEMDTEEEEGEEKDCEKGDMDADIKMEEPVTPLRKLPSRRARVTKFVEETSDAEDEEEDDEDMQVAAEVERMKDLSVKDEDDEGDYKT
ncbi:4665f742-8e60-4dba-a126-3026f74f50f7 [Sclerotinia trifoliorum]|uniref:4665f742-8e60-4dba-a126-3026f74f50f7 n=1 Tax=Sclerotinia trifoliorum TaxID=28548 RepID=A0A8H2ZNG7_9HELO|nr:4665f742-8e60-4dba-a126-3026f74f50f7 [Sclerotinia trifoliorum]